MAGAMWNCCHLGTSSVYTIQPCISLQCHFIQSHTGRVHMCLAVTCHLHFWQNDWDLLRATAVTQGWNGYRNKSQHRRLTMEKKIILPLLPRLEPGTFQSRVWLSNQWAIPTPAHTMTRTHTHNHGIPHSNFETVKPLQETSYSGVVISAHWQDSTSTTVTTTARPNNNKPSSKKDSPFSFFFSFFCSRLPWRK